MAAVPAACSGCGAIFWVFLPFVGGGAWELVGNLATCPQCGGQANIADGLFNFTRDGIEVMSAPDVTLEMLAALRTVLRQAYEQDLPVEEIKDRAEAIHPLFGVLFDPANWSGQVKAALIVALGGIIATWIGTRHEPVTLDSTALLNAIQNIPAAPILSGEADQHIATEIKRILGPPKLKPDDVATPPEQTPETDKRR